MLLHFYVIFFLNIHFSFTIKLTKGTSPMALQTSVLLKRTAAPSDACPAFVTRHAMTSQAERVQILAAPSDEV